MGTPLDKNNDYDERLLKFITQYTKENKVPPTFQIIIDNLKDIHSKSSLHIRLQKLMADGRVVQKNEKGYYFPTSLNSSYFIGTWEVNKILELSYNSDNYEAIKRILLNVVNNQWEGQR